MALQSFQAPIRLTRTPATHKVNVKVPVDLSDMCSSLEDNAFLQVNVYFQNTPLSSRFPISVPLTAGFWNVGPAGARLKKVPGAIPTVAYTPRVPGYYVVQVIAITPTAAGPVSQTFESDPTPVTA